MTLEIGMNGGDMFHKHNKSPGQAWGISNPAGLVRRFVQVFRLERTTSGCPRYDRCLIGIRFELTAKKFRKSIASHFKVIEI
jgi:hypothetical protein